MFHFYLIKLLDIRLNMLRYMSVFLFVKWFLVLTLGKQRDVGIIIMHSIMQIDVG